MLHFHKKHAQHIKYKSSQVHTVRTYIQHTNSDDQCIALLKLCRRLCVFFHLIVEIDK